MRKGRSMKIIYVDVARTPRKTIEYRFEWMAGELEGMNLRASRI